MPERQTIYAVANSHEGADVLFFYYTSEPDMRQMMTEEGFVTTTRESAEKAADRVNSTEYRPVGIPPCTVWEREVSL